MKSKPFYLFLLLGIVFNISACFSSNAEEKIDTSEDSAFQNLIKQFESEDRLNWQKPNKIIAMMGDLSKKTVVDLGAGTGYFAFRIATKAKKVIAIEVDQRFISFMDNVAKGLPLAMQNRFESRLAEYDDPKIQKNEVDIILLVNVYHQMQNRVAYFNDLVKMLDPEAILYVVDFKPDVEKPELDGPITNNNISDIMVVKELESAGFEIKSVDHEILPYQYIIKASPKVL